MQQAGTSDVVKLLNQKSGDKKPPLTYDKILVRADRIELTVRLASGRCRMTSAALIEYCLRDFPQLPVHACKNEKGTTFGCVMYETSVPHLLEHLIVQAQIEAYDALLEVGCVQSMCAQEDFTFMGTTQWSAENPLVAKVSVSFKDDLVGLAACNEMLVYLNKALCVVADECK